MPAAIRRRHSEIGRDLLGSADGVDERFAVAQRTATAFVQRELGVDLVLLVRQQPTDAVRSPALFVRREYEDDVAVGDVAFFLEAKEIGDEQRRHRLVVARAAAVVVAVAFSELEWV